MTILEAVLVDRQNEAGGEIPRRCELRKSSSAMMPLHDNLAVLKTQRAGSMFSLQGQEVFQELFAGFGQDGFGVELDAF